MKLVVFGEPFPDKGFNWRAQACKDGKQSKQRITVVFVINAVGESESMSTIVIWKSDKPRCFKNVNKSASHAILQPNKSMDDW